MTERIRNRVRSFRRSRLALLSLLLALLAGGGVFYGVAAGGPPPAAPKADKKAPDVHVSFPADKGLYNGDAWAAGCSTEGVCGTATDPDSGVLSVWLTIRQVSTGMYWNGSAFSSTSPVTLTPNGTASWWYAFPVGQFAPDGDYTVTVKAVDNAGNTSDPNAKPASPAFTVDTTPPPAPDFKKIDTKPGHGADAHFDYTDSEKGVKFQCQLDGGGYVDCGPHKDYHRLAPGAHTFCVEALDKAGNASDPTCYSWNVGAALPYTMGGSAIGTLHPGGPAQPIKVTFDNPNSDTVLVTTLTVQVTGVTVTGAGSCAASDFVTTNFSGSPFEIAVGASDLASSGVAQAQWPTIRMIDNGNQDGCIGATVQLSFTGAS